MAASDDFKAALKAGKIKDALQIALSEAIELDIKTWVADGVHYERTAQSHPTHPNAPEPSTSGYRMRTRINIVEGKIDTEVGSHFVGNGPYTDLKDFHISQIDESRDILEQNLDNLEQLFAILAASMKKISSAQAAQLSSSKSSNLLKSQIDS
ncbi:MAG: hypothetical protein J7545_02215 [Roseofilum sp. SBFL]|uniref:hypothetical protein n=1 Tax=unclassified Roseofilum TaxID=2620099 RepID=UPI001AFDE7AB|nr:MULTISPECIES: hypothetical protein [unclassified Roseofilum]MBP0012884.1 hypothetical protein [Roseofilum sp. SID3]MBP0026601.1 hypothetical protein [Roseofilum sp. SID2]MBP0037348.1 hypothetical protein [Roseofilum sp. SID1]MBP0040779.1 hypothetical protein [Roseofilum sp. SBFL]